MSRRRSLRHAHRRPAGGRRHRQPVRRRTPQAVLSARRQAGDPPRRRSAGTAGRPAAAGRRAGPIAAALAGLPHLPTVRRRRHKAGQRAAGLEALAPHAPDIVLVHDAARPFIPPGTVPALLAALERVPGAIPAVPVADTLKRATDGRIARRCRAPGCSAPRRRRRSASPLLLACTARRRTARPTMPPPGGGRPGRSRWSPAPRTTSS